MAAASTKPTNPPNECTLTRLQVGEIIGVGFQGRTDSDSYRIIALFNDLVLSAFARLAPRYSTPKELVGKKVVAMTCTPEEISNGQQPQFNLLGFLDKENKVQLIHPRSQLLNMMGKTTQAGSFLYPLDISKSPITNNDFDSARIYCGTICEIRKLAKNSFQVELDMGTLGTRHAMLENVPSDILEAIVDTQVAVLLMNPDAALDDSANTILTAPLEDGQRVPLGVDTEGGGVVPNGADLAYA